MTKIIIGVFITVIFCNINTVIAQDSKRFKDWNLSQYQQSFESKKYQACNLWAIPKKSSGKYTRRGDVLIHITHLKNTDGTKSFENIVSIEMGYPLHDNRKLTFRIDGKKSKTYNLERDGEIGSLPINTKKQRDTVDKLISDMKKGNNLYVYGVSTRGTKTTDRISLVGFTKAYDASIAACK